MRLFGTSLVLSFSLPFFLSSYASYSSLKFIVTYERLMKFIQSFEGQSRQDFSLQAGFQLSTDSVRKLEGQSTSLVGSELYRRRVFRALVDSAES
jgi:hypothetical protein